MADSPWTDDAVSLVDSFRSGAHDPSTELEAVLAAIDSSSLNAWSVVDAERARAAAAAADTSLPLGGVPIGVKEVHAVAGLPDTEGSLVFADRIAERDCTLVTRLRAAGAVIVGLTTSSEFGGVNLTRTKLNGITRNPWDGERTPGGSSGGAASAVSGGLVTLSTAGDGGGSTRIPAGFCGLFGLKPTYGRIPKGPGMIMGNMTAVSGCVSRSVRDTARFLDVTNGADPYDPWSLPRVDGYEAGIGGSDPTGLRVAIAPTMGSAVVAAAVEQVVRAAAAELVEVAGLELVDLDVAVPETSLEWAMSGLGPLRGELGDRWPGCADQLTPQIRYGLELAEQLYDVEMRGRVEMQRREAIAAMAGLFDHVDLVLASTNPDIAFAATGPLPETVDGSPVPPGNNGALTIPANFSGHPAMTLPAGTVDGCPVGLQVIARHHREDLLLELAARFERERGWPLLAPNAPC